jgi:hypothetical protein
MNAVPIFQIRHGPEESGWIVAATWPDGRTEDITDFASESEANEWIASELQGWLDRRKQGEAGR